MAWHGLCAFAEWRFPMSEYAFRCVDSLNSTASLVLAAVFCVWKGRRTSSFKRTFAVAERTVS